MSETKPKYDIHYEMARFHRRCFANVLDFIAFALLFGLLFIGFRALVSSTPTYQSKNDQLMSIQTDSGMYRYTGVKNVDLVSFLNQQEGYTPYQKKYFAVQGIKTLQNYLGEHIGPAAQEKVAKDFETYCIEYPGTKNGQPYFVRTEEGVVENPSKVVTSQEYYDNVYAPYIDERGQGFLITLVPEYLELTKYQSLCLFAFELPPAYCLSGILIYLIPPLLIRRGRMTLGKALYQIGLADKRLLNCSWKRFLARFAIFYFGELLLSPFTFGLPLIVSFSLMAFSKKKQGFPDYMLQLYEVDLMQNRLYNSYEEIRLNGVSGAKKGVDFKMISRD